MMGMMGVDNLIRENLSNLFSTQQLLKQRLKLQLKVDKIDRVPVEA